MNILIRNYNAGRHCQTYSVGSNPMLCQRYHIYCAIWSPALGKTLQCERKLDGRQ